MELFISDIKNQNFEMDTCQKCRSIVSYIYLSSDKMLRKENGKKNGNTLLSQEGIFLPVIQSYFTNAV